MILGLGGKTGVVIHMKVCSTLHDSAKSSLLTMKAEVDTDKTSPLKSTEQLKEKKYRLKYIPEGEALPCETE